MKGARQRGPVRSRRISSKTLLASALYAALSAPHAYAQPSTSTGFTGAFNRTVLTQDSRSDGKIVRAQQRSGKGSGKRDRDSKSAVLQPVQQVDDTPPARPPRHTVMTADERRLLRQHIEEAVRDLYKR